MPRKKSDEEFFKEHIDFFYDHGKKLITIDPDCADEYNDHSLMKLICIKYWVDIFATISHRQLGDKHGYKVAYVDSMAGCGVTLTKRAKDYLSGSAPGVIKTAIDHKFPFNYIIINEIDKKKADVLKKRIRQLTSVKLKVFNDDILNVTQKISTFISGKTISFIVIDPQGLKGIIWSALHPLLCCKGDAMITWFEHEIWRMKNAALPKKGHKLSEGYYDRLMELFGSDEWKECENASDLTFLFIKRVLSECNKSNAETVRIPRVRGQYFLMLLFTGEFPMAEKLIKQWKENLDRRIQSPAGENISSFLDIKAERTKRLDQY